MERMRWIREIASLGGWAVLALFFMGQMAGYIPSVYADKLAEHDAREIVLRESLEAHRHRQEQLIEKLTVALRVICENNAKWASERNNCQNIK